MSGMDVDGSWLSYNKINYKKQYDMKLLDDMGKRFTWERSRTTARWCDKKAEYFTKISV
ncbi:hypothetical protein ACK34I_05770 [Aeromonas veronii]